ncbi:serine/threonine-protein kinase ATR [Verrucomicrobium sp. GAS474]|uniref:hypothetical protein n=1 Tax=Verrucomicrobium sp. GAS474 TaxID=1882831 RepID=UPI00087B5CAE|nr:hypothetical protein [Verrucomicrobium sp. GAS474]SDT91342.1 serine/threonine-protein kinase ATR [Verrucomicrobium sp. GAS474]
MQRILSTLLAFGFLLGSTEADDVTSPPPPKLAPLMRDFMGINGHFTFRPALYRPVCGLVRNYHPTGWDIGDDTSRPPDFPVARTNRVNWADLYGSWKKEGFTIDASLQFESIPQAKWKSPEADARAYGEAFARAFGPSTRNLVTSAEIGNEPEKWDLPAYRKLFEAMARGLRAGDPKLKIVTAAASASPGKPDPYSQSVATFDGLGDLYDVLNVHTYSMIEGWPTWRRVAPETPGIPYLRAVTEMTAWRDAHAPGKEVWVTEFGYDAGTKKPEPGTFEKWVSSTETEQARWLVRSFLLFSSLGVDRAYLYYYDDRDEPSFHASSGITRNFVPKPAYHAVAHLYATLGDYRFSRVVKDRKEDGLHVFEYVNPDKPKEPIWVAWLGGSPAERDLAKVIVNLDLPEGARVARLETMPLGAGAPPDEDAIIASASGWSGRLGPSPVYLWLKLP